MESTWEKLVAVHSRIDYLEKKRMRVNGARCKEITAGVVGPSVLFSTELAGIQAELYELWSEKRYLLQQLRTPESTSWISPVIPLSPGLPGRLLISNKGADKSL
jgi:hypothetical protein